MSNELLEYILDPFINLLSFKFYSSLCKREMYSYFMNVSGYYCPTGQSIQNPPATICPAGHYCPEGSHAEIDCPSGTYQDQTGQGLCKECVAGMYTRSCQLLQY